MKAGDRRQMLADTGEPLDAHFQVKRVDSPSQVTISFESSGGTDRNQDFSAGFEALIGSLARSNAVIREIRKGKADKRLTLPFPLRLTSTSDARATRLRITGTEGMQGEGFSTSTVARLDMDLEADPPTSLLENLATTSTPASQDNDPSSTRSVTSRDDPIDEIGSLTQASAETDSLRKLFERGHEYTRQEVWTHFYPGEAQPGGAWMTGYARPRGKGEDLCIFMNIGIAGNAHRDRESFDFQNNFDRDNQEVVWFGRQGSHSGQENIRALLAGELKAQLFARWEEKAPFEFLGTGQVVSHEDPDDRVKGAIRIDFACVDDEGSSSSAPSPRRNYPVHQVVRLSPEAVESALDRIDRDGLEPHGRNTTYAVVARDRQYPSLAVAAFAIEADGHAPVPAGGLPDEWDSEACRLLLGTGCKIVRLDERGDEQVRLQRETDRSQKPPEAEIGSRNPRVTTRTNVEYERDQWVVRLVLERANGVCESCENPAPFKRRRGGEPYLEVHHVVPLSEDGPDTFDNAVAICPNCHARCHQGEDHLDFNAALYEKVPTLVRP